MSLLEKVIRELRSKARPDQLEAMVDEPEKLTETQMDDWVNDFNSWDVCDQVCMNLFEKTSLAWKKIRDWSKGEEEFVKRAAFALIACLAWHDRSAGDTQFTALFPLIEGGATAEELRQLDSKAARWIASNAIRELVSEAVQERLLGRGKSRAQ